MDCHCPHQVLQHLAHYLSLQCFPGQLNLNKAEQERTGSSLMKICVLLCAVYREVVVRGVADEAFTGVTWSARLQTRRKPFVLISTTKTRTDIQEITRVWEDGKQMISKRQIEHKQSLILTLGGASSGSHETVTCLLISIRSLSSCWSFSSSSIVLQKLKHWQREN